MSLQYGKKLKHGLLLELWFSLYPLDSGCIPNETRFHGVLLDKNKSNTLISIYQRV